jgi:hypothetical protein
MFVPFVALAFFDDRLGFFSIVLRQGTMLIVDFIELPFTVSPNVSFASASVD